MLQARPPVRTPCTARAHAPLLAGRVSSNTPVAALERLGTSLNLRRGQEIYAEGDSSDYCYRLVEGCVRTVKILADGSRQIGDILLPGDFFGFEITGQHYFSAQAVSVVVVRRYPRGQVIAVAQKDAAVAGQLHDWTARALQAARQQMIRLCRKSAAERMASFLLEMADRSDSPNDFIHLPMSRSDIADYLGLVIETVSRTLTQFKQKGLIALKDTNYVTLLNRQGLEDIENDT
jgi:CRP/FNR family nitrogen fixation transcriptional regulator